VEQLKRDALFSQLQFMWSRANEVKLTRTRTRTRMWYTIGYCRNKHCSDKDIEKDRKLGGNANGKL